MGKTNPRCLRSGSQLLWAGGWGGGGGSGAFWGAGNVPFLDLGAGNGLHSQNSSGEHPGTSLYVL